MAYLSWKVTVMSIFIHCSCNKQNRRFKVDKEEGKSVTVYLSVTWQN